MTTAKQFKKAMLSHLRSRIDRLQGLMNRGTTRKAELKAKIEELVDLKNLIEEQEVEPDEPQVYPPASRRK